MYELSLSGAVMGGVLGGVLFCIVMVWIVSMLPIGEKCLCKKKKYCEKCGKEV